MGNPRNFCRYKIFMWTRPLLLSLIGGGKTRRRAPRVQIPTGHLCWKPGSWRQAGCRIGEGDTHLSPLLPDGHFTAFYGHWNSLEQPMIRVIPSIRLAGGALRHARRSWQHGYHRRPCPSSRGARSCVCPFSGAYLHSLGICTRRWASLLTVCPAIQFSLAGLDLIHLYIFISSLEGRILVTFPLLRRRWGFFPQKIVPGRTLFVDWGDPCKMPRRVRCKKESFPSLSVIQDVSPMRTRPSCSWASAVMPVFQSQADCRPLLHLRKCFTQPMPYPPY